MPDDKPRDQRALGLEECDHVRPDAGGGDDSAHRMLDEAVDPEQRTGLGGDAQYESVVANGHAIVPVRDPALERLDLANVATPAWDTLDQRCADQLNPHRCIA